MNAAAFAANGRGEQMNYKAYNELRLLGHSPEEAMELAESYEPQGVYEDKTKRDYPNKGAYPVRTIGLKEELKGRVK
jgi:hypothetical protein